MRTGLFGGTFDPIHNGHLQVVQSAKWLLNLDRVIFIPAGDPPHKTDKVITDKFTRLDMAQLAANIVGAQVSDWEVRQEKKSYSLDMLRHFRSVYPQDELFFIVGADSFRDLPLWWHYRELLELCTFVVVARPDVDKETLLDRFVGDEKPPRVFYLEDVPMDISSTEIRQMAGSGQDVSHLVPPAVLTFIKTHSLYINGGDNGFRKN
ncbi:MAG: nicotinate-nucleotide adenylyltransferase [Clostridia bacterium]|nr:nicotinate-nucleotide adenylyltransferase [Clostridia bacterium]